MGFYFFYALIGVLLNSLHSKTVSLNIIPLKHYSHTYSDGSL